VCDVGGAFEWESVRLKNEGKLTKIALKKDVKEKFTTICVREEDEKNEEKMNDELLTAASMEGKQTSARRQAATDVTTSFSLRRIALR
jgi:hypothetical protein